MKHTRRHTVIVAGLVFLFFLAIINGTRDYWFIFVTLFTMYVAMYRILLINSKNFYRTFYINNEECEIGESVDFEYRLSNTSMWPIAHAKVNIFLSKKISDIAFLSHALFFGPEENHRINHSVKCKRRGFYTLGNIEVSLFDPLRLFETLLHFDKTMDLKVYPKLISIEKISIKAKEFFGNISVNLTTNEDYTSLDRIREYRQGDVLKRVHWKASAKRNELMVKEFDLSADSKVSVIVNGFKGAYQEGDSLTDEYVASVALSICHHFLLEKTDVTLMTNGYQSKQTDGKDVMQYRMFRDHLAQYEAMSSQPFNQFVKRSLQRSYYGSSVILVTPVIDDNLIGMLTKKDKAYLDWNIVYVSNSDENNEAVNYLQQHGISILQVEPNDEIWR